MKRIVLTLAFAFSMLTYPAAAAEMKPLRVGVAPTSAPILYWERNQFAGLEVDFAEKLGQELGRKIEYVELKFSKLLPALMDKEIDIIMSGMSVTKIRGMQISFANPYMKIGQMPLVRMEERNQFNFPLDVVMTEKIVGVQEHTTSEYLVVQEFPKAKKRMFPTHSGALSALKKGKIDVLILDSPYILTMAMENEGKLVALPFTLTEENLAWGVRKEDAQLLDSVDSALKKWKDSGELKAMIQKRIPGFN